MGENSKQHYVHQAYLKLFFTGCKTIHVLNQSKKIYYTKAFKAINEIACIKHFYDIEPTHKYEKLFATEFEPKFTQALRNVKDTKKISEEDKILLSFYMAFQILRTPRFRKLLIENIKQISIDTIDDYLKHNLTDELLKYYKKECIQCVQNEPKEHLEVLFKKWIPLATSLYIKNWELMINQTNIDYITSSEPIYAYGPSHTGIMNYTTFIFNITPQISLKINNKKNFCENIIYSDIYNISKIKDINKKIAQRSEYVYCTSKVSIDKLKQYCHSYKDITIEKIQKDNGVLYKSKY